MLAISVHQDAVSPAMLTMRYWFFLKKNMISCNSLIGVLQAFQECIAHYQCVALTTSYLHLSFSKGALFS